MAGETQAALHTVDSLVGTQKEKEWYEQYNLRDEIVDTLKVHKIAPLLPLQEKILSGILVGKDVLATGTFGTGKSLAYIIGLLQSLQLSRTFVHGVILVSGSSTATLLHSELSIFGAHTTGLNILMSTETTPLQDDILRVKFYPPHILICTPARVVALARGSGLAFTAKPILVIDEVETILDKETRTQVEYFIATVPRPRQTLLFSSFLTSAVLELSKQYQSTPEIVNIPTPVPNHLYSSPTLALEAVNTATASSIEGTVSAANAKAAAAKALQHAATARTRVEPDTLALIKKMNSHGGTAVTP
eukprot:TRINITY_DN67258_c5_g4_i1.p1 TRINITY_DN67258_c5_g4~~TRINITY_DN67258_c5_g4_i1.p1  ORF type:complete len:304 (-),score=18.05 TRINITY_DN67258_c5_g4_i1:989-1900(-)